MKGLTIEKLLEIQSLMTEGLKEVNAEIDEIQNNCDHKNKVITDTFKDYYENKKYNSYMCPDCKKTW